MRLTQEFTSDIESRFKYAFIMVAILFLTVIGRLYYLQIMKGNLYRFFSTENSIKETKIAAARGMIFDRKGQVIVENRPSYDIIVTPQYVINPDKTFSALSILLKIPREELDSIWKKRLGQPLYQPLVIKSDVSQDEMAVVRARKNPWNDSSDEYDLRGVDVEINYERMYPDSNIATHILGYVREIDPARLKTLSSKYPERYRRGDGVGIGGLEEEWDLWLRGFDGYKERIVNAVGKEVDFEGLSSGLEDRPAVTGSSLKLTIDKDLQTVARDSFGTKKGAAVVVDVNTGGILVMFSAPSYDLNKLSGPEGNSYWGMLATDPAHYLMNRAIQGFYPPGSTYKIVNAIASLSEDVINPDDNLGCGGALMFGGRAYHCWNKGGHGSISLHRAIVSSCDVYFYLTGLRLGVDRLAKYAQMFGFGQKTGIPLPNEKSGLIPTAEWKLKRFGVPWQEGETLSISVGQGYDTVTPLQNALFAAQVANGGKKLEPHYVDAAYDENGNEVYKWQNSQEVFLPVDKDKLKFIKDAMVGVVAEPQGTAHAQSNRKITMGGKTGTAQVIQLDGNAVCNGDRCKDHAWFIAFAPADKPEVAAAVIVEHGGFGASAAAPIAGNLMQKYYEIGHGDGKK